MKGICLAFVGTQCSQILSQYNVVVVYNKLPKQICTQL